MPGVVAECVVPSTIRPDEQDVLSAVEIFSLHEFKYLRLVDAWPCRKVDLIENLRGGNLAAISLWSATVRSRSMSSSSTSCRSNARWSALSAAHLQAIFSALARIVGRFQCLEMVLKQNCTLGR